MELTNGHQPVTLARESFTGRQLRRMRQLVLAAARGAGLTVQRSYQLVLAVNEAATNVVKHAGGRGEIEVIQDDGRALIAVITDQGPGLPSGAVPSRPDIEACGGRGLWLIQEVCDRVEVRTGRAGTQVRLEMNLHSG